MLEDLLTYLTVYKFQILAGTIMGCFCAGMGVFILLKRLTVFGVTLSQATSCAVALFLILDGAEGHNSLFNPKADLLILLFTFSLMLPFYFIRRSNPPNISAYLIAGLVLFAGLSEFLLAFGGGQVKNHLIHAFFGNILTTAPSDMLHAIPGAMIVLGLFIFLYRSLIAVAFDRDHAMLSGVPVAAVELAFFLMLCIVLSEAIKLMGSFYTIAQLILPALVALAFTRRVIFAVLIAISYSAVGTLTGFVFSLYRIPIGQAGISLPTSSTIILVLCLGMLPLLLRRRG